MRVSHKSIFSLFALAVAFLLCGQAFGQTNTVSSGNWSDPSVWSTGVVPLPTETVNVNHPLILDQNIVISTGTYNFFQDVTDLPGGANYSLTATTIGGTLDIKAGTATFGGSALDNSTLFVRTGAALIVGATTINNNAVITIESGATWTINGDFTNNNNGAGLFTISGTVFVNGNYNAPVGSVEVAGSGDLIATGTISTNGSSEVFGSTSNCTTGPCSGQNLCNYSNIVTASQVICSTSMPAALAGTAVGGSPVYAWQSSTTNSTSGFAPAAGTNNTQNYTPGSLAQTTWFRRVVTAAGCTGTSVAVQITVFSGGGWLGTTSDWNLASNWCANAVPSSTTDVTISTGVANMPQITAAANCRNLVINSGASVTINGSNTLSIFGNFTNNGTFTTNTSTVILSGTAQQSVSGNPSSFNNLTINNNSGVVINDFFSALGTVSMTLGNVNLSGYNMTVGTSAAAPGALTYSSGHFYGGTLTRWFNTSTIAIGSSTGLFPVGTSLDYRPLFVGYGSALSSGGTIRVGHTDASTTSTISIADGATTLIIRDDAYWGVSTAGGLSVAGTPFLLRGEGTGFGTVTDVNHLRLIRASGIAGLPGTNAGTLTNPQVNRISLSLAELTNNFHLASSDLATTLPITLVDFNGQMGRGAAVLNWSTASERNFDHFEIERLTPEQGFRPLGDVAAKGNVFGFTDYTFQDINVVPGSLYYRLKIVDLDGSFEYSKVILIVNDDVPLWLSVYPNPVTDRGFHVDVSDPNLARRLIMYDQYGRAVLTEDFVNSANDFVIPDGVAPGVYFIKVSSGTKQEVVKILIR